jgi:hypothetical protein
MHDTQCSYRWAGRGRWFDLPLSVLGGGVVGGEKGAKSESPTLVLQSINRSTDRLTSHLHHVFIAAAAAFAFVCGLARRSLECSSALVTL